MILFVVYTYIYVIPKYSNPITLLYCYYIVKFNIGRKSRDICTNYYVPYVSLSPSQCNVVI